MMFNTKIPPLLMATMLLAAIVLAQWSLNAIQAAPLTDNLSLNPTHDAYTESFTANTTYDEGLLIASQSCGADSCNGTRYTYLKYDLSTVNFSISEAQLSLATLTCNGVDAAAISIYGALDDYSDNPDTAWEETGLTWNNQPNLDGAAPSPLLALDAGTTTANDAAYYDWTDDGSGNLAAWLESQRTGDGIATLRLAITTNATADVSFEDREETGDNSGFCAESEGPPVLQVASTPLAATLATFEASAQEGHISITWQTVSELNNLGFNLYRSTSPDEPSQQLNNDLIPSQAPGSGSGASYDWQDDDVEAGTTYYYWLEDKETSGATTLHPPVSATAHLATAVTLTALDAPFSSQSLPRVLAALVVIGLLCLAKRRRVIAQKR